MDVEQVFEVEQPKNVEQAQRGGTSPKRWIRGKISNTFQRSEKMGDTLDVEQAFDVEQPNVSHQEGWWPSPLEEQDVPLLHFEKEDGYALHI